MLERGRRSDTISHLGRKGGGGEEELKRCLSPPRKKEKNRYDLLLHLFAIGWPGEGRNKARKKGKKGLDILKRGKERNHHVWQGKEREKN